LAHQQFHQPRQGRVQLLALDDHVEHGARVLVARQEITGADRQWAERYDRGDFVRYSKGSKTFGIDAGRYARGERVNAKGNLGPVRRDGGAGNGSWDVLGTRRVVGRKLCELWSSQTMPDCV